MLIYYLQSIRHNVHQVEFHKLFGVESKWEQVLINREH